MQFFSKKPYYEYLKNKWSARQKKAQNDFWDNHSNTLKQVAIGSLGGLMLLSSPKIQSAQHLFASRDNLLEGYDQSVLLAKEFTDNLPEDIMPLDKETEKKIIEIVNRNFGFKVTTDIDNIRLNRNYGLIGGEQHLYRYPGDNLYAHADTSVEWAKYGNAGIAPGLGAWGYFAPSKAEFTETDKQREKYYLAIQTFLVPGYAENVEKYRDFFKYRKIMVVNPKTGQAVVAVIADAGPAAWTGKHLGGSPEVMDAIGLADGSRKGPVLFFFIDDPEDKVPLGPVKLQERIARI